MSMGILGRRYEQVGLKAFSVSVSVVLNLLSMSMPVVAGNGCCMAETSV